jgi:ERCC4-type nuclease
MLKTKIKNLPSLTELMGPFPEYIVPPCRQDSRKQIRQDIVILIDTREQDPYLFFGYECFVERQGLKTGDYSLQGYESRVAIERKSKDDLFRSLGKDRERVKREFERLSEIEFTAWVIEETWEGIEESPFRSRMNPSSVRNTIFSWSLKYNVIPILASDRREAERLTFEFLVWAWRSLKKGEKKCK